MDTKNTEQKKERTLSGEVVSISMKDTIVVSVARYRKHPKYGKFLVRSKRLKAHDKGNTCVLGQTVFIKQTRPMSKDKHYIVVGKKEVMSAEVESETSAEEIK